MKKLLYVHGLKVSSDGSIANDAKRQAGQNTEEFDKSTLDLTNIRKGASAVNIRELFSDYGYEALKGSFDLFDARGTLDEIKGLVLKNKVSLVVASSLGAFYALAFESPVPVIALNPAFKPTSDVPSVCDVPDKTISAWQELEKKMASLKPVYKRAKFAVFSQSDEFFRHKDDFDSVFPSGNSVLVEGPHQLSHYRTYLDPGIELILARMKAAKVL